MVKFSFLQPNIFFLSSSEFLHTILWTIDKFFFRNICKVVWFESMRSEQTKKMLWNEKKATKRLSQCFSALIKNVDGEETYKNKKK